LNCHAGRLAQFQDSNPLDYPKTIQFRYSVILSKSTFELTHIDAPIADLNISSDPEWDMTMD